MPVSVNQVNAPQTTQSKVSFAVQSSNSSNTSVGGAQGSSSNTNNSSLQSTVNSNNNSLTNQANQAKQSGVNVQTSAPKQVSSVDAANADYNQNKSALSNAVQQQNTYNQQYQNAQNQYNSAQAAAKQANQSMTNAINAAKQAGIKVTVGSSQNVSSVSDMQKDYSGQEQAMQNLVNSLKNEASQANAKNQQIDAANAKAEQQYQQQESAYQKQEAQYQKDEKTYEQQKQNYDKAVQGLSKDGVALSGIDPSSITQKLILNKCANATIKVLSSSGVTVTIQNPYNDKNAPKGVDSKELIMVDANDGFKGINGNVITVEYDGDFGSYNGDEITKEVRVYKNLLPFEDPNASKLYYSPTQTFTKARLNIYSDPTDGFWYNGSNGVETVTKYYDAKGNLINFDPKLAYLTIESLNHHASAVNKSQDGSIEGAQLVSAGKADQIKGSSVTVHNGNYLCSDKINDQNSKVWDVTGSLQEYYGAGLFQVGGNEIDIKWSCRNPKEGYSPIVWAQDSTTIPFIPSVVNPPKAPQAPKKPTLQNKVPMPTGGSITVHMDNLQMGTPQLKHASVTYNLDQAKTPTPQPTPQPKPQPTPQPKPTPTPSKGTADVKYVNSKTGQEMPGLPEKTSQGDVGGSYNWTEPQIPGYKVSKVEGSLSGKYGNQPSHTVIYYTPVQQTGTADVKYVNALTGQEMPGLSEKNSQGNIGGSYNWTEPQVPGYKVSKVEGSLSGKYGNQPSHTVIYYTPVQQTGTADVKYVNALTGQEIPGFPEKTSQGNIGGSYNWTEPQIPGYKIVKVEGNLNGKYAGQPAHTVIFYMPIKPAVKKTPKAKKPMIQYQTQSQNVHIPSSVTKTVVPGPAKVTSKPVEQGNEPVKSNIVSSQPVEKSTVSAAEKPVAKPNELPETGMSNESVEFAAAMLALAGVVSLEKKHNEK